jgi:hypothetical protein
MQTAYQFIIKDRRYEGYKKLASFLFLINAVVFIFLAINKTSVSGRLLLFTAAFLLTGYSLYNWFYKEKKDRSYVFLYLLIAVIWITDTPFWYFGVIFILLLVLQLKLERPSSISISAEGINIYNFTSNSYPWSAFNNIILKDGLLSLDFTSNKVIQTEPDWHESWIRGQQPAFDDEDYPAIEKEFNDFCRVQLTK